VRLEDADPPLEVAAVPEEPEAAEEDVPELVHPARAIAIPRRRATTMSILVFIPEHTRPHYMFVTIFL